MKTFCTYFNQSLCHSCSLITLNESDQLKLKEKTLQKALAPLNPPAFDETLSSPKLHFRNKAKFVVTGTLENPIIGLWGTEDLDQGREILSCPIHIEKINELLPEIKKFIIKANIPPYNIKEKKGELKGIILFTSQETKETYLRFILRSKEAIDRIKKYHWGLSSITTLSVNIQPIPHALLEGEEEIFITSQTHITHKLGGINFLLDPRGFVQTNQTVAHKLYETAAQWIKEFSPHNLVELFCGQGAFSFFAAPYVKQGIGIEINPEAIKTATKTSQHLKIKNLTFHCLDLQKDSLPFHPDAVIVNPPRRGLGNTLNYLLKTTPHHIIYSSCNYQTLASDLVQLKNFYKIQRVKIFDMFPHTSHFETLIHLKKVV